MTEDLPMSIAAPKVTAVDYMFAVRLLYGELAASGDSYILEPRRLTLRKIAEKASEFRQALSITPEMRRLIIAARNVAYGDGSFKELDEALEVFATAVPWEEEPTHD